MADNLSAFIQNSEFRKHEGIAYGRINNIFFNVKFNKLYANAFIDVFIQRQNGINLSEINLFLKENKKKYNAKNATLGEGHISIMLNSEIKRIKAEHVMMFVQELSTFLIEKGYKSACKFCSSNADIGYSFQDGKVNEVCDTCHQKLNTVIDDIKSQRHTSGSYGRGIIGAVLGGILGIIPWVILGFLGFIAAISGWIMAYLSYKGYLLLKGKVGKGMIVILVIVLIIFTYVGVLTSQGFIEYQALKNMGYEVPPFWFFSIMMISPFLPLEFDVVGLWGQIGLGLLFTGLGSFTILKKAKKHASDKDIAVTRLGGDLY